MTHEELQKVIEQHKHWINEDCEGWQDLRANLRGADLRGADLHGADREELGKLIDYANQFHRAEECGEIRR